MKKLYFLFVLLTSFIFANEDEKILSDTSNQEIKTTIEVQDQNLCLAEVTRSSNGNEKSKCKPMMCGYNAPARFNGCGCYEFYTKATFLYWQPIEEGLTFGLTTTNIPTDINEGPFLGADIVDMDFDFKPGFKVGVGLGSDYDNWDVYLGYTWYHISESKTIYPPKDGRLFYYLWFVDQNVEDGGSFTSSNVKGTWNLNMDIVDLELSRSYYVGKKLIFKPVVGLRGDWIDQNMHVQANLSSIGEKNSRNKSESWAVGARMGLDTKWVLPCGFKAFGDFFASLLYTDYNKVTKEEDAINVAVYGPTYLSADSKFHALRSNLEFSLALGWGTCFCKCNNYIEATIGYDFNVYFNQNMIRFFSDAFTLDIGNEHPAANLYTQGVNLTMKFDF